MENRQKKMFLKLSVAIIKLKLEGIADLTLINFTGIFTLVAADKCVVGCQTERLI